jgi:hypothetical protein
VPKKTGAASQLGSAKSRQEGCQMVYFETKNPNSGKFLRALKWKRFGIFYGHLKYITAIWYIFVAIW